jgi:PKD repeat protein
VRTYVGFAGIAAAVLVIGAAAIPAALGGQAKADSSPPSTLYVDGPSASCTDTGSGTQAAPFCTIQAAANVVNPGQTVYIVLDNGVQYGPTIITRSGTPGKPITFLGRTTGIRTQLTGSAAPGVLTIKDAQYVTVDSLSFYNYSGTSAVAVEGSQHVTLNNLMVLGQSNMKTAADNILVDGASSDVTVSRTQIIGFLGTGVHVEPGASQVTVTTNAIYLDNGTDVAINGARSAAVTSNGLQVGKCGTGIGVTGLPSGASVVAENNVFTTCDSAASVSVDAASAPAVRTDYNAFYEDNPANGNPANGSPYSWSGVTYSSAAAFARATGQGSHDLDLATTGSPYAGPPGAGSPIIDSADCAAPGELSTDFTGAPRVRDPLVTDTGNGTCHADRGAYELQDRLPITETSTPLDSAGYQAGPVPYAFGLTVTSSATSGWQEPVSYTVDFGDGSAAVPATPGTEVTHPYTTPGVYTVTITAADTSGSSNSRTFTVYAAPDGSLPVAFTAKPDGLGTTAGISPDTADFTVAAGSAGSLTAEIAKASATFGDGQSAAATHRGANSPWSWQHIYVQPGTYTATVTVTDVLGRASTAKTTVTVGDELQPQAPRSDYAHSVPAHGTVKLFIGALYSGATAQADGALLNVKVLSPAKAGSLIVYPDGTHRPGRAAVAFQAGKPAENTVLATSPGSGYVDLYNSSAGPITLHVVTVATEDVETQYGGEQGDTYSPVTPAQVLPRTKIAAGRQASVPVAGIDGVPAGAQDVVLDITSSGSTAPGEIVTDGQYSGHVGSAYWAAGQQVTGLATVPVTGGRAILINSSKGSAYFTASVVGYYVPGANRAVFLPAVASRLLQVTLAGKHSAKVTVAGKDGVPSSGITAAMLNLAATGATAASTVTAYADGTPRPVVSSLSYAPGVTVATAAIVGAGGDGAIDLYNNGTKPVTITVDLSGSYYSYS